MGKPLACAHTIIDYVNTTTTVTWPQNVASVADGLRNYVATSVDKVEPSKLSPYTRPLYQELMDACRSIPRAEATGSRPVTDFIDTILSTVVLLRFFAEHSQRHCKLVPTAASLLKILGAYCSENASTIMDAPFLLPRSLPAETLQGNNFEGSTILLVCASQGGTKRSEAKRPSTSTCQVDNDNHSHDPVSEGSEQAQDLGPVFDVPPDAHILPGRGPRTHCLLPALGVADEHNINTLLAAMTYQRYVWGITLPAVGLCLYTTSKSVFARIVFGSTEGDPEGYHMPSLRLLTSDSPFTHDPSKGVFDMTDPLEALILSQFILQLGTHVDTVHRFRIPNGCQPFTWRADQTDLRPENITSCCIKPTTASGEWQSPVASWRQQTPTVNSCDLVFPQPTTMFPADNLLDKRLATLQAMSSSQIPCSDSRPSAPTLPVTDQRSLYFPEASQSSRTQSSEGTSDLMASRLTKECVAFDLWLSGRSTIVAAVSDIISTKKNPKSPLHTRIEAKISVYESFTEAPDWTRHWPKNFSVPTPCDPPIAAIRQQFVAQKAKDDLTRPNHDLDPHSHAFLLKQRRHYDSTGFQVVMNRFNILLLAVELTRPSSAQHVETYEAGSRHPWDLIFYVACCKLAPSGGPHSVLSDDVWPGRSIKLRATPCPNADSIRSFVELQKNLALRQADIVAVDNRRNAIPLFSIQRRAADTLANVDKALTQNANEPQGAVVDVMVSSPTILHPTEQPVRRAPCKIFRSIAGFLKWTTSGKISSASLSDKGSASPDSPGHAGEGRVWFLSTLGGEYTMSTTSSSMAQVKNRATIYMVTMLEYLALHGFPDIPVFTVAGFGNIGTILMAWKDEETGFNVVFREHTKQYDLSSPMEAFVFAMALHRIYRHQNAFLERLHKDHPRRTALYEKVLNMPVDMDSGLLG